MSKLHALICDCLPLFLKETVLKFIEDESWKIDKKHSKKVRRVLKILPHYHTKMYNILAFKKNRLYLSEQDARAGIRILRRMMRWLFFFVTSLKFMIPSCFSSIYVIRVGFSLFIL